MIFLGIWLIPAFLAMIVAPLVTKIMDRHTPIFQTNGDLFIFVFGMLLWPILLIALGYDQYKIRKHRKAEVTEMIEIHYKDQWYE